MVNVYHIHGLQKLSCSGLVSCRKIKAGISQRQARAADDALFVILMIKIAEGKYIDLVPGGFDDAFVQVDISRDAANIGFVGICHHSNSHGDMLRQWGVCVKAENVAVIKSKHGCEIDFA